MVCPLCASSEARIVQEIPATRLVEAWQERYAIDIRSELDNLISTQLLECRVCGLRYFDPAPVGSTKLYAALEKFDWYYMTRKWEYEMALQDLLGCVQVLEVGCGPGDFVARLREDGHEAEGIELNESAVQMAQSRGLPVHRIDLLDLAVEKAGKYNAVCGFQVLEHVPNLAEFLHACCRLLQPRGFLIIGVPNADSYIRYQFNPLDMPPHHITRWPLSTLTGLPERFPLRLSRLVKEPLADYHVHEYVNTLFHQYAGFLNRHPLRQLAVWLLHNIGLRRWIVGHTVYACYSHAGEE